MKVPVLCAFLSLTFVGSGFAQNQVHLDCATDPNAQCNVDKYCTYTYNNNNCQSNWNSDKIVAFNECTSDAACSNGGKCTNGLCCHSDVLPNGADDCPSVSDLVDCCYEHAPATGFNGEYDPPNMSIPSDLFCGCSF